MNNSTEVRTDAGACGTAAAKCAGTGLRFFPRRAVLFTVAGCTSLFLLGLLRIGDSRSQAQETAQQPQSSPAADYLADMLRAKELWDDRDIDKMRSILEKYRRLPGQADRRSCEWHYLAALAYGQDLIRLGKAPGQLISAAWAPDGQRVATILAHSDGRFCSLHIWNVAEPNQGLSWPMSPAWFPNFCWSPDGHSIVIHNYGGLETGLTIWNAETGKERCRLSAATMRDIGSWSPDSHRLVNLGHD